MAISYKIDNNELQDVWLVLSKDSFVCQDNLNIILRIAENNGIDSESITYFTSAKFNVEEMENLAQTVSFFGDRLIVIKDFNITDLSEDYIGKICDNIKDSQGTHFAIVLTYEDDKALNTKKISQLTELVKEKGVLNVVKEIDEKFLMDLIFEKAKSLDTSIDKDVARYIVQSVGKNANLIIHEIEKYSASCNYTKIDKSIVDEIGVKTLEAKIFDIIDFICDKKPVKALENLNLIYSQGTDEIAVLGALATSFIDIHRCKMAKSKGFNYKVVHNDFEKRSHEYRYQKAMANSNKFTEKGLEEIIELMLKTDLSLKSTSIEKRQLIDILVTQIIVKGMAV